LKDKKEQDGQDLAGKSYLENPFFYVGKDPPKI